jgi:hypothetical protein
MEILPQHEITNLRSMAVTSVQKRGKVDLHKVGKDIYELLTYPARRGFKQRARKQIVELKPDKLYTPSEVSALLNVSYDTAVRRMQKMNGWVDMGTQTRRYKRARRCCASVANISWGCRLD